MLTSHMTTILYVTEDTRHKLCILARKIGRYTVHEDPVYAGSGKENSARNSRLHVCSLTPAMCGPEKKKSVWLG